MMLELARESDLGAVCALYESAIAAMHAAGNNQWYWGRYPAEDIAADDIAARRLYVARQGDDLLGVAAIDREQEEQYAGVNWLFGRTPGSFHRFAVSPAFQGKGLGRRLVAEMEEILRGMGCDCLRCDTMAGNARALALYESCGMRRAGVVHYPPDRTRDFYCLEKPLTEECPLLPLRMHPAFRGGALTPWGGERLRSVYGKDIPGAPTGESLEVSCIPGLESTDDMGAPLPALIARYGAAFAGRYAEGPFPLLLKLIDARESLSVQVHPDDRYAHDHEGGKLGKTEAWLILDAPEGSQLVYGIRPGTTKEALRAACEQGAAVEPLLRRVDVKPGDVCFIPAGCVHAIGAGIMLYEIQQSSDMTYRFYDWDRVDKNGKRRQLHLTQALDVTDLSFSLSPVPAPDAPCARVLDEQYFTLDLLCVRGEALLPEIGDFGLLTALEGELTLSWLGGSLPLRRGESVYLPARCPHLDLMGDGRAALAAPRAGK